jgi:hypothetical protein
VCKSLDKLYLKEGFRKWYKNYKVYRASGMVQTVEHLPSKSEDLSSNTTTTQKKKRTTK